MELEVLENLAKMAGTEGEFQQMKPKVKDVMYDRDGIGQKPDDYDWKLASPYLCCNLHSTSSSPLLDIRFCFSSSPRSFPFLNLLEGTQSISGWDEAHCSLKDAFTCLDYLRGGTQEHCMELPEFMNPELEQCPTCCPSCYIFRPGQPLIPVHSIKPNFRHTAMVYQCGWKESFKQHRPGERANNSKRLLKNEGAEARRRRPTIRVEVRTCSFLCSSLKLCLEQGPEDACDYHPQGSLHPRTH
jgi:hypothetical protein